VGRRFLPNKTHILLRREQGQKGHTAFFVTRKRKKIDVDVISPYQIRREKLIQINEC
jgi:hypothetical protein